jgi:hypothetical protein
MTRPTAGTKTVQPGRTSRQAHAAHVGEADRGEQHQRRYPTGPERRGIHRDRPADRLTHEHATADVERVEQTANPVCHRRRGKRTAGVVAGVTPAVTPEVGRDRMTAGPA